MFFHINRGKIARKNAKNYEKNANNFARERKDRKHADLHQKIKKIHRPLDNSAGNCYNIITVI